MARGARLGRIAFEATWKTTEFFLRDEQLKDFVGKSSYRLARRVGGYTRKTARNSIRKTKGRMKIGQLSEPQRQAYIARRRAWHKSGHRFPEPLLPLKPSDPGKPPRDRTGLLKKHIGFEAVKKGRHTWTMVAGPRRLKGGSSPNWGEAPRLHEHGGVGVTDSGRRAKYPPRPYMKPALDKALTKLPQFIREL